MKISKVIPFFIILTCVVWVGVYLNHHYNLNVVVEELNHNLVLVSDENGNLWEFRSNNENGFKVGEKLILIMDNNGTNSILDDRIVDIR